MDVAVQNAARAMGSLAHAEPNAPLPSRGRAKLLLWAVVASWAWAAALSALCVLCAFAYPLSWAVMEGPGARDHGAGAAPRAALLLATAAALVADSVAFHATAPSAIVDGGRPVMRAARAAEACLTGASWPQLQRNWEWFRTML